MQLTPKNGSSLFSDLTNACCPNKDCKDHNIKNLGNISIRGKYGTTKIRNILYCRTCGKRFSETYNTALPPRCFQWMAGVGGAEHLPAWLRFKAATSCP